MHLTHIFSRITLGALLASALTLPAAEAELNTLTPEAKAAGWRLLFDGKTTHGWRSFKKDSFPSRGWVVEEGTLRKAGGVKGGDIITLETFSEFDLQWEWRISPAGNNGVKYFITESRDSAIGHEYQMIDDQNNPDGKLGDNHKTAAFYDVLAARADKPLKPVGEWNHSRVFVHGQHVEHWLNGAKVLEYELGSDEVKSAVARSKFKNVAGFGTRLAGHILLTDHQDECWFRNIKIRDLSAK